MYVDENLRRNVKSWADRSKRENPLTAEIKVYVYFAH